MPREYYSYKRMYKKIYYITYCSIAKQGARGQQDFSKTSAKQGAHSQKDHSKTWAKTIVIPAADKVRYSLKSKIQKGQPTKTNVKKKPIHQCSAWTEKENKQMNLQWKQKQSDESCKEHNCCAIRKMMEQVAPLSHS